jgi:hypothetical protein
MKKTCMLLAAIVVAVTSCKKGTEENPIFLDNMELSELTLNQLPYQDVDTIFFNNSIGKAIEGLIFRDTLKDQWHNHEDSGNIMYRYRKQSQAIVLIFPSIGVTFKIIFENMYWEPGTEEQIDHLSITINDLEDGGAHGVLRTVTDKKNASEEIIQMWYENLAIPVEDYTIESDTYLNVIQGATAPEFPIHFYYNSTNGILSFQDHDGKQWNLLKY